MAWQLSWGVARSSANPDLAGAAMPQPVAQAAHEALAQPPGMQRGRGAACLGAHVAVDTAAPAAGLAAAVCLQGLHCEACGTQVHWLHWPLFVRWLHGMAACVGAYSELMTPTSPPAEPHLTDGSKVDLGVVQVSGGCGLCRWRCQRCICTAAACQHCGGVLGCHPAAVQPGYQKQTVQPSIHTCHAGVSRFIRPCQSMQCRVTVISCAGGSLRQRCSTMLPPCFAWRTLHCQRQARPSSVRGTQQKKLVAAACTWCSVGPQTAAWRCGT